MQGYFRDAQQTKETFHDGWFKTGHLVKRDADGYYSFVSRKRDIIRRRGEDIAGVELDRVIDAHSCVHEAATVSVAAELGEDDILVGIVPMPRQRVTAQDIALWWRERLAPQKVPRYVLFVDDLPPTRMGMLKSRALIWGRRAAVTSLNNATAPSDLECFSRPIRGKSRIAPCVSRPACPCGYALVACP